jgi:hypothetical protein
MSDREATIQEIQLELIRRASFNQFDGKRVVNSLLANRELWIAVLMDRVVHVSQGQLSTSGLIKLRDMRSNHWNVDTLFVLAPDAGAGHKLAALAEEERWSCDEIVVHDDPQFVSRALGEYPHTGAIVEYWWD